MKLTDLSSLTNPTWWDKVKILWGEFYHGVLGIR